MDLNLHRWLSALLLLATLAVTSGASAGIATSNLNGKAPEYLARLIEEADSVEFTAFGGAKTVVTDSDWQRRIAGEVRSAKYRSRGHCLCISFPEIRFRKGGKVALFVSFHHGERIRVGSAEISGDFEIGKDSGRWIWTIVAERIPPDSSKPKRRERQLPEPTVRPEVQPVLPESQKPALAMPELPKGE